MVIRGWKWRLKLCCLMRWCSVLVRGLGVWLCMGGFWVGGSGLRCLDWLVMWIFEIFCDI